MLGAIQRRVSTGGFPGEARPREQEAGPAGLWEGPSSEVQLVLGLPHLSAPTGPSRGRAPSPPARAVPSAVGGSFLQNRVHSHSVSLARGPARQERIPPCHRPPMWCQDLPHVPKALRRAPGTQDTWPCLETGPGQRGPSCDEVRRRRGHPGAGVLRRGPLGTDGVTWPQAPESQGCQQLAGAGGWSRGGRGGPCRPPRGQAFGLRAGRESVLCLRLRVDGHCDRGPRRRPRGRGILMQRKLVFNFTSFAQGGGGMARGSEEVAGGQVPEGPQPAPHRGGASGGAAPARPPAGPWPPRPLCWNQAARGLSV